MFYLDLYPGDPPGFHLVSSSTSWEPWVRRSIPGRTNARVRGRLVSNLKHILVGLEMKAGLIVPHGERGAGRPVLFEPYCQSLTFEFCIGVFSVCEGLGSIHHLLSIGDDGSSGARVQTNAWIRALVAEFDPRGTHGLEGNVTHTKSVRDKMHQDRLGARADIDWHDFGYGEAFMPAMHALQPLLTKNRGRVPCTTNLLLRS